MSCNGCRVLRKRCSEDCILRTSLQWIHTSDAQANATLFVAKFFGRADLMSFISAVPHHQRPVLFQSLLFEACGRTINPISGAVGLLCSGNWKICQDAVEAVLSGAAIQSIPSDLLTGILSSQFSGANHFKSPANASVMMDFRPSDLSLSPVNRGRGNLEERKRRETTPFESDVSEGSFENGDNGDGQRKKLLNLFV
ncbi:hypothetical protein V2J09_007117 [Rumex salicifolius]